MKFHENNYVKVENFLSPQICKICERYALYDRYNNFNPDKQVPDSHVKYADPLMESLLMFLRTDMEKHTGLKLIPTYSFFRIYKPGDILEDHTDRPSCEISATITIGFKYVDKTPDYRWSLHGYVNNKKCYIPCEVGDAVIYKGLELNHGREYFDVGKGSYQVQVFLHYVDADGPYKDKYKYDGRRCIGAKLETTKDFPFSVRA
jgi:hypothetical protein